MESYEPDVPFGTATPEEMADYLFEMLEQMAQLARHTHYPWIAKHLEAIVTAQRAIAQGRPEL